MNLRTNLRGYHTDLEVDEVREKEWVSGALILKSQTIKVQVIAICACTANAMIVRNPFEKQK